MRLDTAVLVLLICILTRTHGVWPPWDSGCRRHTTTSPTAPSDKSVYLLLSERDSGSNFINVLVKANFDGHQSKHLYHKHMYAISHNITLTEMVTRILDRATRDHFGLLLLVRDPASWLMAMYDNHHECQNMLSMNKTDRSFAQFLDNKPWTSLTPKPERKLLERYDDVFHLRKAKLEAFQALINASRSRESELRLALIDYALASHSPMEAMCVVRDQLGLRTKASRGVPIENFVAPTGKEDAHSAKSTDVSRSYLKGKTHDARRARGLLCARVDWELERYFGFTPPREYCGG